MLGSDLPFRSHPGSLSAGELPSLMGGRNVLLFLIASYHYLV